MFTKSEIFIVMLNAKIIKQVVFRFMAAVVTRMNFIDSTYKLKQKAEWKSAFLFLTCFLSPSLSSTYDRMKSILRTPSRKNTESLLCVLLSI